MDIEKIRGLEKTFRIRIGKYRIIFHVDTSEKTVYVTHAEARKKAYTKLD
jgi:mRNA-degrading endonuclease RelE of RelBE toxin-antitoxin system